MTCLSLIGIFGYIGYLYNKKYNTKLETQEIKKNDLKINLLEILGLILDLIDNILISSQKLAPESLYTFYSHHKIVIKLIYVLGGIILIGIFSAKIYFKSKKNNKNNAQFNEVEFR